MSVEMRIEWSRRRLRARASRPTSSFLARIRNGKRRSTFFPGVSDGSGVGIVSSSGKNLFLARFDVRSVAPEILEFIELADIFAHDVNDDVEVIEHDPICIDAAVGSARADLLVFLEVILDFVDDRA